MNTSPVFRHAKPGVVNLYAAAAKGVVVKTDTPFTNEITQGELNRALFDVLTEDGVLLSRETGFAPDYWFENGVLKTKQAGNYILRTFDSIMPFERNVINVGKRVVLSDGELFKVGVPFWPQLLSQPEFGVARISNDGRHIAYVPNGYVGQVAFSYRLINAFGQCSEPACVNVTATQLS